MKNVKKILNLLTLEGWRALNDYRRLTPYELNSRNAITIAFAGSLLAVLLGALSLNAIGLKDWREMLDGRKDIVLLPAEALQVSGIAPKKYDCDVGCSVTGVPEITGESKILKSPSELNDQTIERSVLPASVTSRYWARLEYQVQGQFLADFARDKEQIILRFHRISFRYAAVRVNDVAWGTFTGGQPIRLALPSRMLTGAPIRVQIDISVNDKGEIFGGRDDMIPPFVASPGESRRVEELEFRRVINSGGMVSVMSRVLIAIFALMLFLFIDSAPESLGLSLFLGFEGLAIGLGQGWISTKVNPFVIHYCYQMGDIFRLYFFLQLARLAKPYPKHWLFYGTLLSIPYGIAKQKETEWGLEGLDLIPRIRDSFAGSVGAIACLRTMWSIWGMNLPWRRLALLLGAVGSIQQVMGPLKHYVPVLESSEAFRGFYVVYEALSVYILAIGAFANISTLENRVRRLSEAKVKSDLIEQELELGRTVQKAFLTIPKLPKDFSVVGLHEAAVYVSGDIYFVHWDEIEQRMAIVLSDVTGHGVQASLKAMACYMVARNLWQSRNPAMPYNYDGTGKSKLRNYHQQATDLLSLFSETPDIATFGGIEIFARSRRLFMYRNNFQAALLFEPNGQGGWTLVTPRVGVAAVAEFSIKPGSVIAIFSDGFVDGSRQLSSLTKFITRRLESFDGRSETVREMFTQFNEQNQDRPDDDRTLIVVSWKREEYLATVEKSA